ncbi:MAG TPA: hypothetical protein VHQ03_00945 [Candidatus Dormibacteraeota bacterium]|nr:hypothetical protein [Candidatus Dormibacteraeota bacterium]
MKRRDMTRVERRRSLVEMNLTGDSKPGLRVGRSGCASLFGRILLAVALLAAAAAHLG